MNELLAQFIPEARDLLEMAGAGMLALEQDAANAGVINDVFRAVHTLKGSSGLFDAAPLTRLVHAAEEILVEVRAGDLALDSDIVDQLLDSLDVAGRWIDALESQEALPADAEATTTQRVARLRALQARERAPAAAPPTAGPARAADAVPGWVAALPEADRLAAFAAARERRLVAWTYVPEPDCFFRGDDPLALVRHSPGLLAMRARAPEPLPALATLDPLASFLSFEILADAPREALEHHVRYVADSVAMAEIDADALAIPIGEASSGPVFADFADRAGALMQSRDRAGFEQAIAALANLAAPASAQASALRWCRAWLEVRGFEGADVLSSLIETVRTGVARIPGGEPLAGEPDAADRRAAARRIAAQQLEILAAPAEAAVAEGRLEAVAAVLRNLARSLDPHASLAGLDEAMAAARDGNDLAPLAGVIAGLGEPPAVRAPAAPADVRPAAPEAPPPAREPPAEAKPASRSLRVEQAKIDAIMDLVGELVVAKNSLAYLARRAEETHGSRAMAREIKEQFAVVDRIAQGLQAGVMSVRMMPAGQIFQRFPRLVRDIARKLGKQIALTIEGEDTEADKTVLESLADPLLHMVRNSLDHGLETPDERRAAGKPETGSVRILARQESDFVVIEVSDDGRGIDPRRVKDKAARLGLITAQQAEEMSDEEAANLVFAPGFSTKEEASDLSGRGVGMDVVRSSVVKAGGEVSLRSKLGQGTSVTLRLPLTMAVTRIVTVECRGRIFGVPMDAIDETARIGPDRIHRIREAETFVWRDAVLPIRRLSHCLQLDDSPGAQAPDEMALMILRIGRERVGVIVDAFRERLEVIVKPLGGLLEGAPGLAGASLLGDGRVLLVLDLQDIL